MKLINHNDDFNENFESVEVYLALEESEWSLNIEYSSYADVGGHNSTKVSDGDLIFTSILLSECSDNPQELCWDVNANINNSKTISLSNQNSQCDTNNNCIWESTSINLSFSSLIGNSSSPSSEEETKEMLSESCDSYPRGSETFYDLEYNVNGEQNPGQWQSYVREGCGRNINVFNQSDIQFIFQNQTYL